MSPTLDLILAASSSRLTAERAERLGVLVAQEIAWDDLPLQAGRHGVLPNVFRNLKAAYAADVPADILATLKRAFHTGVRFNLLLADELAGLLADLHGAGVEALSFKGPALAVQAYGNIAHRVCGDLDLLIAPDAFRATEAVLHDRGYAPDAPVAGWRKALYLRFQREFPYRRAGDPQQMVDLHTGLAPRRFGRGIPYRELAARSVDVAVPGCTVRSFCPEDALLYVAFHGAKHRWDMLKLVCDVAEVVEAHPALDWDAVLRRAEATESRRMLRLGLHLAERGMAVYLPPEVRRWVDRDPALPALARDVQAVWRQPEQGRAGERFRYHLQVRDTVAAKLRYVSLSSLFYSTRGLLGVQH